MARRRQMTVIGHRELATVGHYRAGLGDVVGLEQQIAKRAAQVEADLLGRAKTIREAMPRATGPDLRSLQKEYMRVQHRIGAMRRAVALSRHTQERMAKVAGRQGA